MGAADNAPILTIRSRAELRAWLSEHHTEKGPVWLASFKKHHPDYLPYEPVVEELLCWGWIDSVTRALDADRSMILIAPRNPKSAWSAINKAHVERARASGAMTPAGEAKIAAALANGQWSFLDDVERLEVPGDLAAALGSLRDGWEGVAPLGQARHAGMDQDGKDPRHSGETHRRRVRQPEAGLRPSPFRR